MNEMTGEPPRDYRDVVEALAAVLSEGAVVTDELRRRAEELADAAGIEALLASLTTAERILRTGEGFHSIERFFVDGSEEQRYLIELNRRDDSDGRRPR